MKCAAFVLALLTFTSASANPVLSLYPAEPTVCANDGNEAGSKRWKPTLENVAILERALPEFLELRRKAGKTVPAAGVQYDRQYEGIERGGRKYIRGLFYPFGQFRLPSDKSVGCISISDGGNTVWWIEFEVGRRKFLNFSVNGVA